jgi:hypothetical protein
MGGVVRVLDGRSVVEQPRSTSFPLAGRSRLPPPYGYGSTTVIRPSTVPALGCRDTMASRKHHGVDAGGDDDLGICRRVVGTHHPGAVVVRQRDAQGRSRNHQRRAVSHGEAPDLFRSSTISGGDRCTTRNGGGSSGRRGDWDRFVRQGPRRGTFPAKRARKRAVRRLRPPRSDARAFKAPGLEVGNLKSHCPLRYFSAKETLPVERSYTPEATLTFPALTPARITVEDVRSSSA